MEKIMEAEEYIEQLHEKNIQESNGYAPPFTIFMIAQYAESYYRYRKLQESNIKEKENE